MSRARKEQPSGIEGDHGTYRASSPGEPSWNWYVPASDKTIEGHSKGDRNKGKTLSKKPYGSLASSSTSALPNTVIAQRNGQMCQFWWGGLESRGDFNPSPGCALCDYASTGLPALVVVDDEVGKAIGSAA